MLELHSNFTIDGSTTTSPTGMWPTNHALHETFEITHGFTDWFEVGFYIFTSASSQYGWQWVGDHIRPRVRVPDKWKWPVGVSVSTEFGYQRKEFSPDTWTFEFRPIIDKTMGRWYVAFNPALDRSFHGPSASQGTVFSPNLKVGYDVTKRINMGVEYYGSVGPVNSFDAVRDQEQQIVPCIDLNLGEQWEFNFGVGIGMTSSTDHLIVKMILGRRFTWGLHDKPHA
jgi:hypothetical protein